MHMTNSLLLIAALLFAPVLRAQVWEHPVVIAEEGEHKIAFQRMYVDRATSTKHFLYAVQMTRYHSSLFYRRLYANGTLTPAMEVLGGLRNYRNSDLTGADDGKRVFLSVCARRVESEYYDVYFMESGDAGDSFSKPVAVPRVNMTDAVNRYSPNIRFNGDRERLWIFYFAKNGTDAISISYVSRPKDSIVFSPEQLVAHNVSPKNQLRFELVSSWGGRQSLYVGYLHMERNFFWPRIYVSCNGGLTWDRTDGYEHYAALLNEDAQMDIAACDAASSFYYSANTYRGRDGYETQYFGYYPAAHGRWETVGNDLSINKMSVCSTENDSYIVGYSTVAGQGAGRNHTGHLVVMKYRGLEDLRELIPPPFGKGGIEYLTSPDLSCRVGETRPVISASGVGVTKEGKNVLLFAQAAFDPAISSD